MSAKFNFTIESDDKTREIPRRLILGCQSHETRREILLKLLAYLLLYRPRIQIEVNLHDIYIPFNPPLVELDYQLRPKLWVEVGESSYKKLDKLAVKVPEAEIWIFRESTEAATEMARRMMHLGLRKNRYQLVGFEESMFEELEALMESRNEVFWVQGGWDPTRLQFDFNGLWFDAGFLHLKP